MSETTGLESPGTEGERPDIRLESIRKTFANGTVVACEDIDLDISSDEFVVLLGPSGCGKTTTLRCIAGLEEPDSGRIWIGDRDVTHAKPKDRDLAFVFQSIALFPNMNVRENMRFGLDMKDVTTDAEKDERVEDAARILGIEELLDRAPAALSGGQQQRVSLGRAMVMEPAAFLLDEPFSALDANLRDQMQTEVKQLQRRLDTPMIFVTHDQEEAMSLGDKIVIMRDGHIQQVASPYEIYNEPVNQFVAEFIGSPSTNMIAGTLERDAEGMVVETDAFALPVPSEAADDLSDHAGERVTLGIRPEYLELESSNGLFDATVEVIEPQGLNDTVHIATDQHDFRATTRQGRIPEEGIVTSVDVDATKVWLFDTDGNRLL